MSEVSQAAFEAVVSQIKDVHSKLDVDGKRVLVALLEHAKRGEKAGGVPMNFAPDMNVLLGAELPMCW